MNRISYTEIYPLIYYAKSFATRHDTQFRFVPTDSALKGFKRGHLEATHVLVQTWLTDPPERFDAVLERLNDLPNDARKVYLDSFANSDIRLAKGLSEFDLYYKKSILNNEQDMLRPTYGHTTLTEYYGRLYGIEQSPTDWQVPPEFLERLRLAPNFLTGPGLIEGFLGAPPPPQGLGRDIDVHARLGGMDKDSWYGIMRRSALAQVEGLGGIVAALGTGISSKEFMAELRRSKICFSPFGYGELCWRDIEAFMTGSVLLKPDMSHLRTEPDLFRDDETYVAIAWDFSDLEEKVRALLTDHDRRARIAATAWDAARRYLANDGPVRSYADIFS
ncbi:MAG: glycosyltransferase [Pseudomonadota bacterium]